MSTLIQQVFKVAVRDDILVAMDNAELALRTIERRSASDTGITHYDEMHQLVSSAYERLCHARQIAEGHSGSA